MMNVYQVILSKSAISAANKHGRGYACMAFPEYDVYMKTMFGGDDFLATDFMHYTKVATVQTDDPEDCFTIMNRWSDEDTAKVTKLNSLHSLSVGDIVEKDGKFFFCDNCGFKEVYIPTWVVEAVK